MKESAIETLFAKRPDEFVAARNELARRARDEGDSALAIRIAAMRKPSPVVWLVNQIAREHPADVRALLGVGKRLRDAQEEAFRGSGPAAVREATDAWRAAVATIRRRGREIRDARSGPAVAEPRVAATLLGAAARAETANLLARGALTDEIEPPGFESVLGTLPRSSGRATSRTEPAERKAEPRRKRAAEDAKRKREEAERRRALERGAAAALKEAEQAVRVAATLERRAKEASEKAARARSLADAARKRANDARSRL